MNIIKKNPVKLFILLAIASYVAFLLTRPDFRSAAKRANCREMAYQSSREILSSLQSHKCFVKDEGKTVKTISGEKEHHVPSCDFCNLVVSNEFIEHYPDRVSDLVFMYMTPSSLIYDSSEGKHYCVVIQNDGSYDTFPVDAKKYKNWYNSNVHTVAGLDSTRVLPSN